jgi:hypothetical protein
LTLGHYGGTLLSNVVYAFGQAADLHVAFALYLELVLPERPSFCFASKAELLFCLNSRQI